MTHSEAEMSFYRFLTERLSYKPEHVLFNYRLPHNWAAAKEYIPDIAIINPKSKEILAVIEIKTLIERERFIAAYSAVSRAMGQRAIPFFLVFVLDAENQQFEIHQIVAGESNPIDPGAFPPPGALALGNAANSIQETKETRKDTLDEFKQACYFLSWFLFMVLILDFLGWVSWTKERLMLLTGAVVLIVIPNATKLKVLGIEFERLLKKNEQEADD
jgi:hypothetical protein